MARLDIGEGDGDQPLLVCGCRRCRAQLRCTRASNCCTQRQVVGGDEAELLEERMAGRQSRRTVRPWSRRSWRPSRSRRASAPRSTITSASTLLSRSVSEIEHGAARACRTAGSPPPSCCGCSARDRTIRPDGLTPGSCRRRWMATRASRKRARHLRLLRSGSTQPAQAELIEVVLQLHRRQQFDDAVLQAGHGRSTPADSKVDPLRVDVEQRIAGACLASAMRRSKCCSARPSYFAGRDLA